ncbi:MAG: hypothetical protein U7123_20480 [Potamolinea sp.]
MPDRVLLPWLPSLILRLRPHAQILQVLLKEASMSFPKRLSEFDKWQPVWERETQVTQKPELRKELNEQEMQVKQMLLNTRTTTETMAQLLGVEALTWEATDFEGNLSPQE